MEIKEIEKKVKELLPPEIKVTKVEAEGLSIVVYLRNVANFYESGQLIKRLASGLRKKVIVRSDPSYLQSPDAAKKFIQDIIPKEADVKRIDFNPEFCEVEIIAFKPGLVIGKEGCILKEIISRTGWSPKVLRSPTMESSTIDGIRKSLLKQAAERKKFLMQIGKNICHATNKSDWVKVTALGGYREVGRSCTLLQTPNDKILIDCGINAETYEPTKSFPYLNAMNLSPEELDAVIVTHAHLDHSGFIPYLYAYGFKGPVYCTPPTRDLMILLQMDYLNVTSKVPGVKPPYGIKDIQEELVHTVTLDYNEVIDITPEMKLTFYNAGHILGSSMVHLHIGEGLHNVVFSGDIKYGFTRLFDQANTTFPRVESLFIESTYGGRQDIMPKRFNTDKELVDDILKTTSQGGKVLIPVFSVGRSQEIMLVLEQYAKQNPDFRLPVYLDGMILEASAIHTAYPEYLRHNIKRRILSNDSPFESEIFEPVKGNREDIISGEPSVILAPSGMMSGGPSVGYFKELADDKRNMLIFVGYQSALSLGRKIQRGVDELPLMGEDGKTETVKVNMQVQTIDGFSGHSDRKQLLSFVKNLRPLPEQVFTGHGDERKCESLAKAINKLLHLQTRAPMDLDALRLK